MHQPSTQPRPSIYYQYKVFKPWLTSQNAPQPKHKVVIVGAGATGVELSAELHHAVDEIHNYGFDAVKNSQLKVTLVAPL